MSTSDEPRPDPRDSVFLTAQVVGACGATRRYRIRNLSREGACVEQPEGLQKDARLTVSIGLIERVPAEVAWARGGFAGLRFLIPIDTRLARQRPPRSLDPRAGWGRANRL